MPRRIILASQSPYRRTLLARLRLPFEVMAHALEERPDPDLSPRAQVERLALDKARSLTDRVQNGLIIGSDQGLVAQGQLLGKPGTAEGAQSQLFRLAGGTHELVTAVTVLDADTGRHRSATEVHKLTFRALTQDQVRYYVDSDRPLDCAGSFRIESLGIALFSRIQGEDPTAIMGLPLIGLARLLADFGVAVLGGGDS